MRVLVVHNKYRSDLPSGENAVVSAEIEMLRTAGVDVVTHLRSSDEIAQMSLRERGYLPLRPTYSPQDVRAVRRLIDGHRVDVMHVHQVTPLISPAVIRAAQARGVAVVQTVHNHRHVCMKGTYFRDGKDCTDCLGHRFRHPGVQHGCYRGSRAQSVAIAMSLTVHHGTWRGLDRYLALTPQLAEHLTTAGIPPHRVVVRPNTVADPGYADADGTGFVYVGRVEHEKGVRLLLDAWQRQASGSLGTLTIVGDGDALPEVREVMRRRPDVEATGLLDPADVGSVMSRAAAVVIPSLVPDVFPRVAVEALALGKPVVATEVGGLPDIVAPDAGWLVPREPAALASALRLAAVEAPHKRRAARRRYVDYYSPDRVLTQLLRVYEDCIMARSGSRGGSIEPGSRGR